MLKPFTGNHLNTYLLPSVGYLQAASAQENPQGLEYKGDQEYKSVEGGGQYVILEV
jgi:hypothetical protein